MVVFSQLGLHFSSLRCGALVSCVFVLSRGLFEVLLCFSLCLCQISLWFQKLLCRSSIIPLLSFTCLRQPQISHIFSIAVGESCPHLAQLGSTRDGCCLSSSCVIFCFEVFGLLGMETLQALCSPSDDDNASNWWACSAGYLAHHLWCRYPWRCSQLYFFAEFCSW